MIHKRFLFIFFLLVFTSFLSTVSAISVNILTPANYSNVTGPTYNLQAYINDTAGQNVGSVTFYFQPWSYAITGNGTWIHIVARANTSSGQTVFTYTWNTLQAGNGPTNSRNFTMIAVAKEYLTGTNLSTTMNGNVTIDNGFPAVIPFGYTNGTIKTSTSDPLALNLFVYDYAVGLFNTSNMFCFIDANGVNNSVPLVGGTGFERWCNTSSLSLSGLGEGNKTITFWANDTLANLRRNNSFVVQIDTVVPSANATCNPQNVKTGDSFPCSCITSDSTSGINNASSGGSSNSPDGVSIPSTTGIFTYTCLATDNGGLNTTSTAIYTVTSLGSGNTTQDEEESEDSSDTSSNGNSNETTEDSGNIFTDLFGGGNDEEINGTNESSGAIENVVNSKVLLIWLWITIGGVLLVLVTWLILKRERKVEGIDEPDTQ